MKHEKTFAAIEKLKDVELELHRLKNALEMANRALDAQPAQEPDRQELQANGTHPAPCARHCEAQAFKVEIRNLEKRLEQPAQQPQVRTGNCLLVGVCASEGHKIQAQRPWVGLTNEETIDLAVKVGARLDLPPATKMQLQQQFIDALRKPDSLWMLFARDIEAKLKEKNT